MAIDAAAAPPLDLDALDRQLATEGSGQCGVDLEDDVGRTRLHRAAIDGALPLVALLLQHGADVGARDCQGRSPLHYAAAACDRHPSAPKCTVCPEIVNALLKAGANPNAADENGVTPLHRAVQNTSASVAELLLNAGANPNSRTHCDGRSPLHAAFLWVPSDSTNVIATLVKYGASLDALDNAGATPLHYAAMNNARDSFTRPPQSETSSEIAPSSELLWLPSEVEHKKLIYALLAAGADPNAPDIHGKTPLHFAAGKGSSSAIELLINTRADINTPSKDGSTPLHYAARRLSYGAVQTLLDSGARPDIVAHDGTTPLRNALTTGSDLSALSLLRLGAKVSNIAASDNISAYKLDLVMNSLQTDMRHAEGLERQYYVELLSKLYVACRYYPSSFEPGEDEIRVTKGGGKDEESEGLLLGRHRVVMKRVPERDRAGIEQKAAEWKQLRHPNVVPFLGLHTIDSTMYIVSPWMENGDAPRYMERNPDTDSRRLLLQAAEGLKYLHGLSPAVVHGNLRGSNILIDGAGEAHLAGMEFSPAVQAETGGLPSTSRWQAPELLKSRAGQEVLVTPASDMFSFGRIILELSQKDVPFAKIKDDAAILTRVTSGVSPARPPSIDARLWELYKECCHMRPERRPSAEVLVVRLQSLCSKKARTSVSLFGWK